MKSTSILMAAALLCVPFSVCCGGEQDEPPAGESPSAWMLERRIERIRGEHGDQAVLDMVADELREALYPPPNLESWCRRMLKHLEEHGTEDSLPIIEKWLSVDLRTPAYRGRSSDIAYTRHVASRAWYRIKERRCATRGDRLKLALSLLEPTPDMPPLDIRRKELPQQALSQFLPEARTKLYDVLLDPGRGIDDEPRWPVSAVSALLELDGFRPTHKEMADVLRGGGTLGRFFMLRAAEGTPLAELHWRESLQADDIGFRYLAHEHFALSDLRRVKFEPEAVRGAAGLNEYLLFLRQLQDEPFSETIEKLKSKGMGFLRNRAYSLRGVPEVADFVREFLANQPELETRDLLDYADRPGKLFPDEASGIRQYRKEARTDAQAVLDHWAKWEQGTPEGTDKAEPEKKGSPTQAEASKAPGPPPSEEEEGEAEPSGEPGTGVRIRFFLDGREIPKPAPAESEDGW